MDPSSATNGIPDALMWRRTSSPEPCLVKAANPVSYLDLCAYRQVWPLANHYRETRAARTACKAGSLPIKRVLSCLDGALFSRCEVALSGCGHVFGLSVPVASFTGADAAGPIAVCRAHFGASGPRFPQHTPSAHDAQR